MSPPAGGMLVGAPVRSRHRQRAYRFGPYCLDTAAMVLLRRARVVPVPPRALEVLVELLRSRGRVVAAPDLIRRAWGSSSANSRALTRAIAILRRALSSSASHIETIPRRGYRLALDQPRRPRRTAGALANRERRSAESRPPVDAVDVVLGWCSACDRHVWIASPREAAAALGTTIRAVFRAIENGGTHYRETTSGDISVCMPSLIEHLTALRYSSR